MVPETHFVRIVSKTVDELRNREVFEKIQEEAEQVTIIQLYC